MGMPDINLRSIVAVASAITAILVAGLAIYVSPAAAKKFTSAPRSCSLTIFAYERADDARWRMRGRLTCGDKTLGERSYIMSGSGAVSVESSGAEVPVGSQAGAALLTQLQKLTFFTDAVEDAIVASGKAEP